MKLLSLNTHSLEEKDMAQKQKLFADYVKDNQPDIIALQEVNQTMSAPAVSSDALMVPVQDAISLKEDNHALAISRLLQERGLQYHYAWLPIKVGYDRYDEGLAIFSKKPILETANLLVSKTDEYSNYRTRRILGIRTEDGWFYDIHMSWWNDPDEPFLRQWQNLQKQLPENETCFLMGDFNGDAQVPGQSYDRISEDGWLDTYLMANQKDAGWTVSGQIDGWRDQAKVPHRRIDQIWVNQPVPVKDSRTIFNGENEPVISDHYGLQIILDSEHSE